MDYYDKPDKDWLSAGVSEVPEHGETYM